MSDLRRERDDFHAFREWRRQSAAHDQACGHCGEGMGFGWVDRLVACYPCYRDAERGGLKVSMEAPA